MGYDLFRAVPVGLLAVFGLVTLAGCDAESAASGTRIHLANGSDLSVVFLAIEDSETAVSVAPNRLTRPLPPKAIFSAVLPRPGNYWVHAQIIDGTSSVHRIEGPIRIDRGVLDWEFTQDDAVPLYQATLETSALALALTVAK